MSDAAPPPPPDESPDSYSAPPPPPPAAPSGSSAPTQVTNPFAGMDQLDLGQIGAAVLLFISSLLPYYTYSYGGIGGSVSAWNGFFGWFATLLGLAAAAVLAVRLMGNIQIGPTRLICLGLWVTAFLCVILALFVIPHGGLDDAGFSSGHGFGYWLAFICTLAGIGLSYMRLGAED